MLCGSRLCDAPAACRVFWPGKTMDMCIACADRACDIAIAMSFDLKVELLPQLDAALKLLAGGKSL